MMQRRLFLSNFLKTADVESTTIGQLKEADASFPGWSFKFRGVGLGVQRSAVLEQQRST